MNIFTNLKNKHDQQDELKKEQISGQGGFDGVLAARGMEERGVRWLDVRPGTSFGVKPRPVATVGADPLAAATRH